MPLRFLDLTGQLDAAVLWTALVFCTLGTYATAVLGRQSVFAVDAPRRRRWMGVAVLAAASAIWLDAVLVAVAFPLATPPGFAPTWLAGAFVLACLMLAIGAQWTLSPRFRLAGVPGGAMAGLSIPATQFVAMQGLATPGAIAWDPWTLGTAMLVGVVLAAAAAMVWVRSRTRSPWIAIMLFVAAICGAHCVGIAAMWVSPDIGAPYAGMRVAGRLLVGVIALAGAVVIGSAWIARTLNRRSRIHSSVARKQLEQLAEVAVEGLVICEGSRIVWVNRSLENMAGLGQRYVGTPIESLLTIESLAGVVHDREFDASLRVDGSGLQPPVPVRVIVRAVDMSGRPHIVVAVRDQRARLRAEAEMQRLAESDALTGLANRSRFNAELVALFAAMASSGARFALMSLDLDRFKSVNDTYGHAAGDAVLIEVAERLRALIRNGDLVARLGGDEFAILARTGPGDVSQNAATDAATPASIEALADRAIETIMRPFVIDGRIHQIGVSIGIAFAASDGDDPESLTRSADLALYRAKADGRGIHRLFEPGMRTRMQERHGLEQDLRRAIAHNEFRLLFQPQADARTGVFNGAEALIQWMHPTRGLVPTSEFIPVAEETNLIFAIGEWVLRTACAEAATWPDHLMVAVNLSPVQFRDPVLVDMVASALSWTGLPGHRLELEITENVLIDDTLHIKNILDELKSLGIRLSLDDFGTGYSSLGRLHQFPFDKIKVDRTFVRGVPDDAGSVAIIRAVVALAAGLRMKTTVEGVETEAQRHFVEAAGCDQIQGFFYSGPVAAEDLPAVFREVKPRLTAVG